MSEEINHEINLNMKRKTSPQSMKADGWFHGIECHECGTRMKYEVGTPYEDWAMCDCWDNNHSESLFQTEQERDKWLLKERVKDGV